MAAAHAVALDLCLTDQVEVVRTLWFNLVKKYQDSQPKTNIVIDPTKVDQLAIVAVYDFLVENGIAHDRDKARETLLIKIGGELMSEGLVNF